MSTPRPRQATSNELLAQLRRVVTRLTRALNAVEAGEIDAIDDAAAVLRTLICRGRGDDLIRRVVKQSALHSPVLCVTSPPSNGRDVHLSFGNFPVQYAADAAIPTSFKTLSDWSSRAALVVRGAVRRSNTWEMVISDYANTYGSHAGTTVPEMLDTMSSMYSDRMNLGEYLVWSAGVAVEAAMFQLLDEADGRSAVRSSSRRRTSLLGLTLSGPDGSITDPTLHGAGMDGWTEVLKLHPSEKVWLRVTEEPDPSGETSGIFSFEQAAEEPSWWNKREERAMRFWEVFPSGGVEFGPSDPIALDDSFEYTCPSCGGADVLSNCTIKDEKENAATKSVYSCTRCDFVVATVAHRSMYKPPVRWARYRFSEYIVECRTDIAKRLPNGKALLLDSEPGSD